MTDIIDRMIADLHVKEGGYVDDPEDGGGPTKNGISLDYARSRGLVFDLDRDGDVDKYDIMLITDEISDREFKDQFYYDTNIHLLPELVQPFVFDFAVNSGPGTAIKGLQRVLNRYAQPPLDVDGDCGPHTQATAIRVVNAVDNKILIMLVNYRLNYVEDLCQRRPSQKKFLRGWQKRIQSFLP